MIGMFDNQDQWIKAQAMGVANYGQMTAGGWMYIGPQGIVHGTYNSILNAGRMKLGIEEDGDLRGHIFVSSGLGGMSGAQGKATKIANGVGIIAEVDYSRIRTRLDQGWIDESYDRLDQLFERAHSAAKSGEALALAYHGNIVDLLEYAVNENIHIELLSDQTSCHAPYDGGYCPQGMSFEERTRMLSENKNAFVALVNKSLIKHYHLKSFSLYAFPLIFIYWPSLYLTFRSESVAINPSTSQKFIHKFRC